ncbi:PEP-CTERM sorting domain-containing protein [Aquincola sp. MAHUQ-54]|uniref:PEP-CTERM sorting domain-containing protein n=1 Tax=Aquincola agrisoli TaxID=3119538 RepID=A0AAW9QCC4_9BURK
MIQRIAAAIALWAAAAVAAAAVPATTVQFQTNTIALVADASDARSESSPLAPAPGLDPVPLFTSALAVNATDFASAGAIASGGLFSTSAEADSATGFTSAAADAHYTSTYTGPGVINLSLQFTFEGAASAGSAAAGSLSVVVWSGGVVVFDQLFSTTGSFDLQMPLYGADHVVDLQLFSEASTDPLGGFAASSAQLAFDVAMAPVPEPGSLVLALAGLAVLGAWTHRRLPSQR